MYDSPITEGMIMSQIQRHNLAVLLATMNGATFMGIDTESSVKLTGGKANPFKDRVTKRQTGSTVMLFQNKHVNGYESMVKRRLAQEGKDPDSFELGPRLWGTRIPGAPIIEHNGEHYLECTFQNAGPKEYLVDGVVTDQATITGMPAERDEGEQGGLDNKVIIRTFKMSSLTAVRIGGQEYVGEFYYEEPAVDPTASNYLAAIANDVEVLQTALRYAADNLDPSTELSEAEIKLIIETRNQLNKTIEEWTFKEIQKK